MSGILQKKRALESILPSMDMRRLVILTGARQTGKTTLVKDKYASLRYINLDAAENREDVRSISTFGWGRSIGNSVIDEAQKEPSVFEKIKYAYDAGELDISVLTGSAQILLLKRVRESLSGRVFLYELWPLMLSEMLTPSSAERITPPLMARLISDPAPDTVLAATPERLPAEDEDRILDAEKHLLSWGGMPELLRLNDQDRRQWLRSYLRTYLERDLADLVRLTDLEPFKKFETMAALRSGKLLSYSELGRDAGISSDTARRYLEYLRLSYQTVLLPPYSRNLTSQMIKTPKIYWADVGLYRTLSGFWGELSGELYETMVVSEFNKWIKTMAADAELSFYRTRSGLEVDMLVRTPYGIVGVEVKARAEVTAGDCSAMRAVAEKLGNEWLCGLCVYLGRKVVRLAGPRMWAAPSFRLFS